MSEWKRCAVGVLYPFSETGTEGVVWSIQSAGAPGWNSLVPLLNGDLLRVLDDKGVSLEVAVDLEFERHQVASSFNPDYRKQAVHGMWVNGLQRDMDPEPWGDLFFKQRPAVLFRQSSRRWAGPWQGLILDNELWDLPPHEIGQAVWSRADEALRMSICQSIPHGLRYTATQELGWSVGDLRRLLSLSSPEHDLVLSDACSSYLEEGLVEKALAFMCALDYAKFFFSLPPDKDWRQAPEIQQLRNGSYEQVLVALKNWAPENKYLLPPQ